MDNKYKTFNYLNSMPMYQILLSKLCPPGSPVANLSIRLNSTLIAEATDLQEFCPWANLFSCLH